MHACLLACLLACLPARITGVLTNHVAPLTYRWCTAAAVWYHVISGRKVFLAVPPTPANLAAFEEWSSTGKQASRGPANTVASAEDFASAPL
jgi:hypothetical protein